MYTVVDYGRMAADPVRMDAFCRAIARSVKPGSVVLDLGAGNGIMSILALRAGASRVHAVEPNDAVWLIPEIANENGLAGRVVVHQASSLDMDVPEPIDVVISDMRGALPLLEDNFPALLDVAERWLAPGGIIMPTRDELKVTLVDAPALAQRLEDSTRSFENLGIRASAVRRTIRNQVYSDSIASLSASDVLTTTATWATIDYHHVSLANLEATVVLEATRGGVGRGLAAFFDTELVPGVRFTTAPGHSVVYHRLYLPLLEEIVVEPGDRLVVTMRADVRGERIGWDTTHERAGASLRVQRQSTFLGEPSSLEGLMRGSSTATPRVGSKGSRLGKMLLAMDGSRTVREIAEAATTTERGESAERLVDLARNLAIRYGV